ncbi:uncharacterized protein LOC126694332 [Quercus robur]|uniref:uncharacterized protein LOC126694332 n=1 Tax=Quercus robur TaxID=38942 RepID=UPI002162C127|nr:uncharacterized protein LOC126694332 [Quercus robur]
MVCELLKEGSKERDIELVRRLFLPQDVEAILSTPISDLVAIDRMVWAEDKKGRFTVKSAYRLAREIEAEGEVWSSCKLSLPFNVQESWSFLDTFSRLWICWETQQGMLERWVSIYWGIWKSRNEVWHGGKKRPGLIIVINALRLLEDYHSANVKSSQSSSNTQNIAIWKPPPPGYFKVNVDGALFAKSKQSGVGVIVRDEDGNVVAAMCRKLDLPLGV